jgi:L-tartrate/succinate antiporter
MKTWVKALAPVAVAVVIAAAPAPPGLAQHAWYFFACSSA